MQNKSGTEISSPVIILDTDDEDKLFRAVIRRSLAGIFIIQQDRVVFSNPALQGIVGMSEEEILHTNPFDLVHSEDRDLVRERAEQRLKGMSPPDDYEFRILHADGPSRWVRVLATSISYRGKPAVLANILDIEEQKRAEELEHEADRLRSTLLDSLPHPAMLIRRDHTILAANRHARDLGARVGGNCAVEFGGKVLFPDFAASSQSEADASDRVENTKCRLCMADQAFEEKAPASVRGMEVGSRFWDAFWIPVDLETYLHYAVDVTEQQKTEQKIRNSEERYRLITDTMTDGLSIQNRDGVITGVNRRLCEMTGFSRDELIGRPMADFVISYEWMLESSTPVEGDEAQAEAFLHHKDGRKIAVTLRIDSIADDEKNHKGSFAFFSDISELKRLRPAAMAGDEFENIVGHESVMRKLFSEIVEIAACDFPVLIQGESGTGKELVAEALHNQSHRSGEMFVPVNCAALPEGLLESELFGHVKGAFTGALRDKKGRFELAHRGTIFLDEIAELSPAMQVKLLRILQEGAFERVGDQRTTRVDVRIISATNKILECEVTEGRFRQDLFYRLCVMPIQVPPLRERKNDIPILAEHFITAAADRTSNAKSSLSPEAMVRLMTHDWPGNVRELQNVIQYACVKSKGGTIRPSHLPAAVLSAGTKPARRRKRRRKLTEKAVRNAIDQTNGNKLQAAKLLGVSRATLYRFLAEI